MQWCLALQTRRSSRASCSCDPSLQARPLPLSIARWFCWGLFWVALGVCVFVVVVVVDVLFLFRGCCFVLFVLE